MSTDLGVRFGIGLLFLCLLASPVMAGAYSTIQQGGTVFIGEQGLNVNAAIGGDTSIGWWASGAAIASSSPDYQMPVSSPTNFYVSPTPFGQYTGTWYRLNAQGKSDGVAFVVADPSISIRVIDISTNNLDVTNKWLPRGDQAAFRIDSNLDPIFSRGSSSTEGVTIYVESPAGGTYSSLADASGTLHSLENIALTSPSYQTPWAWDSSNSQYVAGTYTIWAKCDVNGMYDNYGIPGKTITAQTSLLDQEQNPLISVNVPTTPAVTSTSSSTTTATTVSTPVPTTVITTLPTTIVVTTTTPVPATTTATTPVVASPSPTVPVQTSPTTPGFSGVLAFVALLAAVAVLAKKQG